MTLLCHVSHRSPSPNDPGMCTTCSHISNMKTALTIVFRCIYVYTISYGAVRRPMYRGLRSRYNLCMFIHWLWQYCFKKMLTEIFFFFGQATWTWNPVWDFHNSLFSELCAYTLWGFIPLPYINLYIMLHVCIIPKLYVMVCVCFIIKLFIMSYIVTTLTFNLTWRRIWTHIVCPQTKDVAKVMGAGPPPPPPM